MDTDLITQNTPPQQTSVCGSLDPTSVASRTWYERIRRHWRNHLFAFLITRLCV